MFQVSISNWNSSLNSSELRDHLSRRSGKVFGAEAAVPTRAFIAAVLEGKGILAQCLIVPPAPAQQLASAFMAMAHGLALERDHDAEAPAGRLIVTFLKGLIASAAPLSREETRA